MTQNALDKLSIAAIRSLVIDITNNAKSGHPGMALDAAPIVYALFKDHLIASNSDPKWINRDRFVLSSGHNSALLYAILHLAGYKIKIDDLKNFRQLGSITPGHPEVNLTPGVDATAGPLGQGISQAVGMALATKHIAASYPDGDLLMNHYTYCLCGDGCLEEGISQESISLAGHLKLNNLILFYDENTSTLDGPTSLSLSENIKLRFEASEWNTIEVEDGNDYKAISKAIEKAKKSKSKPTVIIVKTIIGYGSKYQGLAKTHGSPLGEEDGSFAKASYGYKYPAFTVPKEVYNNFKATFVTRGQIEYLKYKNVLAKYSKTRKQDYKVFIDAFARNTESYLPKFESFTESEASRVTSGKYLQELYKSMPFTIGGSADVASSVNTKLPLDPSFSPKHLEGRNLNFGIREFAMAGIQNGILLHGGLVTYVGCFLMFSDYMKNAIRMACLEQIPAIYLFSHDSIAVGEDGPTHQPIETLAGLRCIPNINVIRPADQRETVGAYKVALVNQDTPTCIILSRQGLPLLESSSEDNVSKGAYVVFKPKKKACMQIVATGSEVGLSIKAAKGLEANGQYIEVISMPSMNSFLKQEKDYINKVLSLPIEKRISIEMASTFGWAQFAKYNLGIDTYGASAPAKDVLKAYEFDEESIINKVSSIYKKEVK